MDPPAGESPTGGGGQNLRAGGDKNDKNDTSFLSRVTFTGGVGGGSLACVEKFGGITYSRVLLLPGESFQPSRDANRSGAARQSKRLLNQI